ncbi:MAG: histone deacetylase [Anaerolineae bacterium]|nr:histone deacetylase [Anaerolineae bacterium]
MPTAFVCDPRFASHTRPDHPENAARLAAVEQHLEQANLTDQLVKLEIAPATDEDVLAVHSPAYLAQLDAMTGRSGLLGLDTYLAPRSYKIARLAAGGVLRAVDAVMCGDADNALAAIRPPGHHATPFNGMGFCLLNNVAVAARYAQRVYGVERVLIVDYDVHHGNGTQDVFYTEPTVLYISTHQWPLYPGTGAVQDTGSGPGAGYTINVPLPPGVGDKGYAGVFEQLVWPAAQRFDPGLVLVSAGFDAHWADPLAHMRLSLAGYDHLTRELLALASALCEGRIVFVLEGGYNLQVLGHAWANVARSLLGIDRVSDPLGSKNGEEPAIDQLVVSLKRLHKLD